MKILQNHDVPVMILASAVLSVVAISIRLFIVGNFSSPPNLGELQEAAVKRLAGEASEKYFDDGGSLSDGANIISYDKGKMLLKVNRADTINGRRKAAVAWVIFAYTAVAAGVMIGIFLSSRLKYRYVYLVWLSMIALLYAATAYTQYRSFDIGHGQKKGPAELSDGQIAPILQILNAADESGCRTYHDGKVFIGKKKNFGIDFARITVDVGSYLYITDEDLSAEELKRRVWDDQDWLYRSWEKIGKNLYRCHHDHTRSFIRETRLALSVCCGAYSILFLTCIVLLLYNIFGRRRQIPSLG